LFKIKKEVSNMFYKYNRSEKFLIDLQSSKKGSWLLFAFSLEKFSSSKLFMDTQKNFFFCLPWFYLLMIFLVEPFKSFHNSVVQKDN